MAPSMTCATANQKKKKRKFPKVWGALPGEHLVLSSFPPPYINQSFSLATSVKIWDPINFFLINSFCSISWCVPFPAAPSLQLSQDFISELPSHSLWAKDVWGWQLCLFYIPHQVRLTKSAGERCSPPHCETEGQEWGDWWKPAAAALSEKYSRSFRLVLKQRNQFWSRVPMKYFCFSIAKGIPSCQTHPSRHRTTEGKGKAPPARDADQRIYQYLPIPAPQYAALWTPIRTDCSISPLPHQSLQDTFFPSSLMLYWSRDSALKVWPWHSSEDLRSLETWPCISPWPFPRFNLTQGQHLKYSSKPKNNNKKRNPTIHAWLHLCLWPTPVRTGVGQDRAQCTSLLLLLSFTSCHAKEGWFRKF